jgi:hypothetical protein
MHRLILTQQSRLIISCNPMILQQQQIKIRHLLRYAVSKIKNRKVCFSFKNENENEKSNHKQPHHIYQHSIQHNTTPWSAFITTESNGTNYIKSPKYPPTPPSSSNHYVAET